MVIIVKVTDNFDNLIKYKLYRNVKSLLHPSISKSNISNYKIVLDDGKLPIRVFYPKRVSNMKDVVIYIPSDGKITDSYGRYTTISRDLAIKTNKCLIAVDYFDEDIAYPYTFNRVYEIVKYIYEELFKIGLTKDNITLMGDSFGATLVNDINIRFIEEGIDYISKCVVFYPMISMKYDDLTLYPSFDDNSSYDLLTLNTCKKFVSEYINTDDYYNYVLKYDKLDKFPDYLVVVGEYDPLIDEVKEFNSRLSNSELYCLESNTHGFLKYIHTMKNDVYDAVRKYIDDRSDIDASTKKD